MAFRVGQRVVCVDGSPPRRLDIYADGIQPTKGEIYTVSRVGEWKGEPFIDVAELPKHCRGSAPDWCASRFRPVVERKTETGMAILREILERESHQDRVPVKTP